MENSSLNIDHLVYAVPNLKSAIELFRSQYAITAYPGGKHLHQGTHNAIIKIGPTSYLELLAVDNANQTFKGQRWMGVDLIKNPTMTRWCLSSNEIERESLNLKSINNDHGTLSEGQRQKSEKENLKWRMTKPLTTPKVDPIPFLIDWSASQSHPVEGLKQECNLESFSIEIGPEYELQKFKDLFNLQSIYRSGEKTIIKAAFKGPKGQFILY